MKAEEKEVQKLTTESKEEKNQSNSVNIIINSLTGQSYNFEIDVNKIGKYLYEIVAEKFGTKVENIKLIFKGYIINTEDILSSINIISDSIIYAGFLLELNQVFLI